MPSLPPPPPSVARRRPPPGARPTQLRSFVDDEAPTTRYTGSGAGLEDDLDSGVHSRPEPSLVVLGPADLVEVYDTLPSVVIDDIELIDDDDDDSDAVPTGAVPVPSVLPAVARGVVTPATYPAPARRPAAPVAATLHPAVRGVAVRAPRATPVVVLPVVPRRPVVTAPVVPIVTHPAAPPPPVTYAPPPAHWSTLPPPAPATSAASETVVFDAHAAHAAHVAHSRQANTSWWQRLTEDATYATALFALVLVTGALTGLAAWLIAFH